MTVWTTLFPFSVWECWWLAPAALIMDALLGDPDLPWRHPVCFVGGLLQRLESPARRLASRMPLLSPQAALRVAGMLAVLLLVLVTGLIVRLSLAAVAFLPGDFPQFLMALYWAWAGLALGSLVRTGATVRFRVENFPLPAAREALSWLVSRDTSVMDRPLMRKTLADTLSENFTDAGIAPLFWLLVGGPVALWCYKAVSTTDSMWGYLTPRWRWLGWAGARGDDLLAFLPARLGAVLLYLTDICARAAARILPFGAATLRPWDGRWPGLSRIRRDAAGMPSPNSGWSMAACAWLCRARQGGPSVYFGELVHKEWLGPPEAEAAPWDEARLTVLNRLLLRGMLAGGLILWAAALLARGLFFPSSSIFLFPF